jgi:transcriptional regulator with XRE-family HTH domain
LTALGSGGTDFIRVGFIGYDHFIGHLIRKRVLPRRITSLRRLQHLSQAELARKAGLQASTISTVEGGLHDPRCSTVEVIAEALGVMPGFLLGSDVEIETSISPGTIEADQNAAHYAGLKQALASSRRCGICFQDLLAGEPHGVGHCLLHLYESGKNQRFLSLTFGLSITAIDAMLDAEYRARSAERRHTGVNWIFEESGA